ncbi:MAG: D-alanine--D-alanine ligase A, partial [Anaerolineae bacterium]
MNAAQRKICVGILFGGRSGEHEVSLASAQSILENIDREQYEVVPIGITKEGEWIVGGDPLHMLSAGSASTGCPATLLADPSRRGLWNLQASAGSEPEERAITAVRLAELDVVFPVLHGTYGE